MADTQVAGEATLEQVEAVRDLFARAHDYLAQAQHPGHMGGKVAEVLNFLAFQYNDFKLRGEKLAKRMADEKKAKDSVVDVDAAKLAATEAINEPTPVISEANRPQA